MDLWNIVEEALGDLLDDGTIVKTQADGGWDQYHHKDSRSGRGRW